MRLPDRRLAAFLGMALASALLPAAVPAQVDPGAPAVRRPAGDRAGECRPPLPTSIVPVFGAPGTPVTISGANLDATTAVSFGPVNVPFGLAPPSRIETMVPDLPPGQVSVRVTKACGAATISPPFLVVAPSPSCVLGVVPQRLDFTTTEGETRPPPAQTLTLTSLQPGVSFTARESSPFLSLGTAFGVTPAVLNIRVDPTGLPVGGYSATIEIACPIGGGGPLTVPVNLAVFPRIPMPPRLTVEPRTLSFSTPVGSDPPPQNLEIRSTEDPEPLQLNFSIGNPITPRLRANPSSGRTPQTVSVSIMGSDLAAGTYDFSLFAVAQGVGMLPLTVPVRLLVTSPAQCSVNPSPASLGFTAMLDGPNPAGQTVSLTSPQGAVAFITAGGPPLVAVAPASGSTPASLAVSVSTAGLPAGTYTAAVGVGCAENGFGGLRQIPVTVTVTAPGGQLLASPPMLSFSGTRGGPNPPPQTLSVASSGAPLGFTATASGGFFTVNPAAGTTAASLGVSANLAGLAEGVFEGMIALATPGKPPLAVPVRLTVSPPPSLLMASPSSLSFTTTQDLDPPIRTLTIASSGAPLNWSVSSTAGFISLGPTSGVTPSSTFVAIGVVGKPPGTYSGSVVVTAPGAGSISVPVSLTITGSLPNTGLP